jgi:predicted RecB family nuclease
MTLAANFQFSQSSLQDYAECARRFELRYIQRLKWPAVEAEPVAERERHMRQGAAFHHMVHQHLLGVPAEALTAAMGDQLREWWENYLSSGFVDKLPEQRYPEIMLSSTLDGYRLTAKYDLIAVQPGERVVIVDWKTAQRKPERTNLAERLQTVIYPYLLVQAGAHINGGEAVTPEQVEMIYWFAADPGSPEHFAYTAEQYRADSEQLAGLIAEIQARGQFDLTTETGRCRFCTYRSLCERGIVAGNLAEMEAGDDDSAGFELDFDFDQIAEIEF